MRPDFTGLAPTVSRVLCASALVLAPWMFGATELWALRVLQLLVALAFVAALVGARRQLFLGSRWWIPAGALAFYLAVQALNASHQYQAVDQSLITRSHVAWLPASVDARATWETLGKFLMYAALFGVVRTCFPHPAQRKWLLTILVVAGFGLAVEGLAQHASGTHRLLWMRTPQYHSDYFATFVNPDNYAAYMNLLIPVALTLGRQRFRDGHARLGGHPGMLFYLMATVMIATVVISKSRMGVLVCFGLLVGWVWLARRDNERVVWLVALLVALAVALVWLVGFGPLPDKLRTWEMAMHGWRDTRLPAYGATWRMFCDHWAYGTGAGTFQFAFPYYQPAELTNFWRYAHNDWLQYLAELGVVGFSLLAVVGGVVWRAVARPASSRLSMACGLALVGICLHAFIDFPLHIPALAGQAVAYTALTSSR